jgi:hypothetical protein
VNIKRRATMMKYDSVKYSLEKSIKEIKEGLKSKIIGRDKYIQEVKTLEQRLEQYESALKYIEEIEDE